MADSQRYLTRILNLAAQTRVPVSEQIHSLHVDDETVPRGFSAAEHAEPSSSPLFNLYATAAFKPNKARQRPYTSPSLETFEKYPHRIVRRHRTPPPPPSTKHGLRHRTLKQVPTRTRREMPRPGFRQTQSACPFPLPQRRTLRPRLPLSRQSFCGCRRLNPNSKSNDSRFGVSRRSLRDVSCRHPDTLLSRT